MKNHAPLIEDYISKVPCPAAQADILREYVNRHLPGCLEAGCPGDEMAQSLVLRDALAAMVGITDDVDARLKMSFDIGSAELAARINPVPRRRRMIARSMQRSVKSAVARYLHKTFSHKRT